MPGDGAHDATENNHDRPDHHHGSFEELVTHSFALAGAQRALADIESAYELFPHQRDGVLKVAIKP